MWGVMITPGTLQSGCSRGSGSGSSTSSAARKRPALVSSSNAPVSMAVPRPTLTISAPLGNAANCAGPSKPRVLALLDGRDAPAIEGKLVFVDNAVDPVSGTLLLKGEFPNRDGRLVPGQFVEVRLVLYVTPRAVVVPTQAVSSGQQGAYVYVVNADSTVTPRPIEVERTVDELAVVSHGLTTGESVVTDGQLRLAPGSKVLVRAPVGSAP